MSIHSKLNVPSWLADCIIYLSFLVLSCSHSFGDDEILTPKPPATPRINGATIFGVRPGHPVLFTIAATGDRPMQFSADGLPSGVSLDPNTGFLSGKTDQPGEYKITLHAQNSQGKADRTFKLVVGDTIGLTPQMGWNSWNCFAGQVTADRVKSAADAMVKSGLIDHGWTYVNIDDFWEFNERQAARDATLKGPARDDNGNINCNLRFPDMKVLCDYIHGLGLKAGLYSSPGPTTCGGCTGSWQHEEQDANSWANWGFDYIKYDLCSYPQVHPIKGLEDAMLPYQTLQAALKKQDRDIFYSLCQYGGNNVWKWAPQVDGNSWRTTGDITDTWQSMTSIWDRQINLAEFAGPGHWNDPDMLIVGKVGWGNLHPSRLTADEQYTHISLWCMLAAPLLIGCDMTQLDDFTLGLLTNDEVLAIDQDQLGKQATRVKEDLEAGIEIWSRPLADGTTAVGLFNRGRYVMISPRRGRPGQPAPTPVWRLVDRSTKDATEFTTEAEAKQALEKTAAPAEVTIDWSGIKLEGSQKIRDLWRQKDLGNFDGNFKTTVPFHGAALLKIGTPKDQ